MPVDPILANFLASLLIALANGTTAPAPQALVAEALGPVVWSAFWHRPEPPATETDLVIRPADGTTYASAASSAVSPP